MQSINLVNCLENLLIKALQDIYAIDWPKGARVEQCKNFSHGECTSNVSLIAAKTLKKSPIEIATALSDAIKNQMPDFLSSVTVAKPGFINFCTSKLYLTNMLKDINQAGENFGALEPTNKNTLLEFISANPTGPIHIGHGRGAAYGDSLARILRFGGNKVTTEYYVNDAGRQINILLLSVYLRAISINNIDLLFPKNAYQGDYIKEMAVTFAEDFASDINIDNLHTLFAEPNLMAEETAIDKLIIWLKNRVDAKAFKNMRTWVVSNVLKGIKKDLSEFDVSMDNWFLETSLLEKDNESNVDNVITNLKNNGHLYEKEGAIWFKSTEFGDDKDRVLKRTNGECTYFATDVAYHDNKFKRKFTDLIDVWGSDHHGYVARIMASQKALGHPEGYLNCELIQFVSLVRGGEKSSMSTRSGEFVTLKTLVDEVGKDACRFYFVRQKSNQHMEFDLELAISQSKDNPVFYVQYAHARICSLVRQLEIKPNIDCYPFDEPIERQIIMHLNSWQQTIKQAVKLHQPHLITTYLEKLAQLFHSYYNDYKIKGEDENTMQGRYALCLAVKQLLAIGLSLIGVSAPEKM